MELTTENKYVLVDLDDLKQVVAEMLWKANTPTDFGNIIIVLEAMQKIYVGIRAFYADRDKPDA